MKSRLLICCWLWSMALSLNAGTTDEPVDTPIEAEKVQGLDLVKERQVIREKRLAAETEYKAALKLCYKKFAVNSCKQDALDKKIKVDNELRSQELVLNNAVRQQRGDKAYLRTEDKQSLDKQLQMEEERLEKKNAYLDKLNENLEKNEKQLNKQQEIESNREKNQQRMDEVLERQRKYAEKAELAEKKRAEFQRKQEDAEKRKQDAAKNAKDHSKTAETLPKPKASELPQ